MQRAIADFLGAAGLSLEASSLRHTPERVTQMFAEEFLEGYWRDPEEALGELYRAPDENSGELVLVTDIHFSSMCPHHLLPYEGTAHVAYVVAGKVVGFGRLVGLVECFAHRLLLQEELASQVAKSLATVLGSPATACIVEARHSCLRSRSLGQRDVRTHAEAYEGRFRTDRDLRRELWSRIGPSNAKGRGASA
jgi:GTP cyclohydrolase I